MFCALLTSRDQVSVYRTNGPLVLLILCRYITDILKMCMKKFNAEKNNL